jgi:hypothetical protein
MPFRSSRRPGFATCLLLLAPVPLAAQAVGPPLPSPARQQSCPEKPADSDEIVVCGQSEEDSPYRVPPQFRNQESMQDRDASWTTRVRDEQSLGRFSGQNDGPAGISRHSRQVDCEWRVARQIAQGQRPDCTRQLRAIGPLKPQQP